jgi:hypothetical protein
MPTNLLTTKQLAEAAGVTDLMVTALRDLLRPYRTGRHYSPVAVPVVALADELARTLRDRRLPERVAARILARVALTTRLERTPA